MAQYLRVISCIILINTMAAAWSAELETNPNPGPEPRSGLRDDKSFGVYVGFLDPYVSFISANAVYAPIANLRLEAGAGTVGFGYTYSFGVTYLPAASWTVSPLIGLRGNYTNLSSLDDLFGSSSSSSSVWSSSLKAGLDWQTQNGFNLGFGLNWAYLQTPADSIGVTVFPYLDLGWFF